MEREEKRIIITFKDNAFNKAEERKNIKGCKVFTSHVAEMNKQVEVLDRYDDFGFLNLKSSDYAKNGEYGIPKSKFHSGDERLLPHQMDATYAFLKELRGFGLLADVVGSGKTYEACAVLSELSAKGKISSAIIIVPSQVYNTWREVLETQFGLGKGALKIMGADFEDDFFENNENVLVPKGPIIVKTEDFVKWQPHNVENVLFDVVVVDEAHNLCEEEGPYANALKLLSIMMETKKTYNKSYCVLLSATPHSGNLENMFRLWYFVRCKGGNPADFDEKEDGKRTEAYKKEKDYYKTFVCRGATTVMEFIENVKMEEVTGTFGKQFDEYLTTNKIYNFNGMLIGEKKKVVGEFLEANPEIFEKVKDNIASAYHDGLLRSIMIRQPNDRIRKGKRIENVFFFPVKEYKEVFEFNGLDNKPTKFFVSKMNDKPISTDLGDYSVDEYVNAYKKHLSKSLAYGETYFGKGILSGFGLKEEDFKKANSLKYYWAQMGSGKTSKNGTVISDEDIGTSFIPVYLDGKKIDEIDYQDKVFNAKIAELDKILTKHCSERVILFFDYDIGKLASCHDKVLEYLQTNKKYKNRVLIGDDGDKVKIEEKFNANQDTILVVTSSAFTEGANLQKSSVIVNFQVTPNPLAMEQRIGRIFRLGQESDVTIYSLADMRELEGYVLMYFTHIGLMTSNSGDAAIIAGSNNDNMVTIRCPSCGKVKLMSKDDHEAYEKNDNDIIYCADTPACRQESKRGSLMIKINSHEIKCDTCGKVIKRQQSSDGGVYSCIAFNSTGSNVMCSKGEGREIFCRKICSIAHCHRFMIGPMKDKCAMLKAYKSNPFISEGKLTEICDGCENKSLCLDKCRKGYGLPTKDGVEAINACVNCAEGSDCSTRAHVISFDDKWEAECPECASHSRQGKLKPIVARTFEAYIRSAYDYQQDGGASFSENLSKESAKVSLIQEILSNDKKRG